MATPKTRRKTAKQRKNARPESNSAAVIPIDMVEPRHPEETPAVRTAEMTVAVSAPEPGRNVVSRKVKIPVAVKRQDGRGARQKLEVMPIAARLGSNSVSAAVQSAIDVEQHLFDVAFEIASPVFDLIAPIARFFGVPLEMEIKEVGRKLSRRPTPISVESKERVRQLRTA